MDREKFKVPRSVQQAIPIQRIWPDGVFQSGTKFSKTFRFSDINYAIHIVTLVLAGNTRLKFPQMSERTDLNKNYPRGETNGKME